VHKSLHERLNSISVEVEDASFSRDGNRVVEVQVLIIPSHTEIVLTRIFESTVNWGEVLAAAHGGNPGLGCVVRGSVHGFETDGQPSLLDLWVGVLSSVVVGINLGEELNSHVGLVSSEGLVEDNLQVTVEFEVICPLFGAASTGKGDVIVGELCSFCTFCGGPVEGTSWGQG